MKPDSKDLFAGRQYVTEPSASRHFFSFLSSVSLEVPTVGEFEKEIQQEWSPMCSSQSARTGLGTSAGPVSGRRRHDGPTVLPGWTVWTQTRTLYQSGRAPSCRRAPR
jgi:hypothetical protein